MPTGYTHSIEKGITFKEYALSCAKAFGACVSMRDDPPDAEIPEEFKVDDYHLKRIEESKKQLYDFKNMSLAKQIKLFEDFKSNSIETSKKYIDERTQLKEKYNAMLKKVRKFKAPSPDHVEFKLFMESQIVKSIEWDCDVEYYVKAIYKVKDMKFDDWYNDEISTLEKSIESNQIHYAEEIARIDQRNRWIKQLRNAIDKIHD
jgi:hypothetical protein